MRGGGGGGGAGERVGIGEQLLHEGGGEGSW